MHSFTLSTLLVSASLASGVLSSNIVIPRALLQVRQGGDAFVPSTRQGFGATCVDAFGANSKLCANSGTCYDASIGDSCCSEGYPCGSGSFCLIKGYCCPNGDSPSACAAANGITLPANFHTVDTSLPTATLPASSAKVTGSASAKVTTGSASAKATTGSTSAAAVTTKATTSAAPFPTSKASTPVVKGSTHATGTNASTTKTTPAPFTGAAADRKVAMAALVGVAGVMGAML